MSATVAAGELPEVTPYRPTVSNPAALPTPGVPEVEFGWARNRNRSDKTADTRFPYLVKYAWDRDLGVLLGGDAHIRARDEAGILTSGAGDTNVALKLRHELNSRAALGLEAGARLPTAKEGLGSGKTDYSLNGIASTELGDYELDVNLGLVRLGRVAEREGRIELGWAAAAERPLGGRWGAAVELSGTARDGTKAASQLLAALTYKARRRLVVDAGVSRSLNEGVSWTFLAGLSLML